MQHARPHRELQRGLTLLELIAVVSLLGIMAAAGISRYGGLTLGNLGAQGDARRIALDMLQARRRAISTGDNHFLQFTPGVGPATGYTLYRRTSGGAIVVEAVRQVPDHVTITSTSSICEFTFEGTSLAAYQVTVAGPNRSWQVSVVPVTGTIRVTE